MLDDSLIKATSQDCKYCSLEDKLRHDPLVNAFLCLTFLQWYPNWASSLPAFLSNSLGLLLLLFLSALMLASRVVDYYLKLPSHSFSSLAVAYFVCAGLCVLMQFVSALQVLRCALLRLQLPAPGPDELVLYRLVACGCFVFLIVVLIIGFVAKSVIFEAAHSHSFLFFAADMGAVILGTVGICVMMMFQVVDAKMSLSEVQRVQQAIHSRSLTTDMVASTRQSIAGREAAMEYANRFIGCTAVVNTATFVLAMFAINDITQIPWAFVCLTVSFFFKETVYLGIVLHQVAQVNDCADSLPRMLDLVDDWDSGASGRCTDVTSEALELAQTKKEEDRDRSKLWSKTNKLELIVTLQIRPVSSMYLGARPTTASLQLQVLGLLVSLATALVKSFIW